MARILCRLRKASPARQLFRPRDANQPLVWCFFCVRCPIIPATGGAVLDNVKTGALIKQLRRDKGMTQKDLAGQLHITDRAVSKWERGISAPDISLLEPLSEILGVSVVELIRGELAESAAPEAESAAREDAGLLPLGAQAPDQDSPAEAPAHSLGRGAARRARVFCRAVVQRPAVYNRRR